MRKILSNIFKNFFDYLFITTLGGIVIVTVLAVLGLIFSILYELFPVVAIIVAIVVGIAVILAAFDVFNLDDLSPDSRMEKQREKSE